MLKENISQTRKLTYMGLLAAVSVVLILLINIPIFPSASYLKYDMADVPILLATFLLGPAAGLEILFVVSAIQAFFLGGDGLVGLIMHFVASGTVIVCAGLVYKKLGQSLKGLIFALVVGTLAQTLMMIPLNLIITVHAYGVPRDVVVAGLIPVTIPFNLLKAALNAIIFFLLYQALGIVFKKKA